MASFKQFAFKKIGIIALANETALPQAAAELSTFVKIVLVNAGATVVIDFHEYLLESDALFFISPGQVVTFDKKSTGTMLYYNRDFYCVEIHDKEVACDGLLFHNVYAIPVVYLDKKQSADFRGIFEELSTEFEENDSTVEEMLRILLKKIIILGTRIWKKSNIINDDEIGQEAEFSRKFSQMVEWFYMQHHTVAAYAELLKITPKVLNKRIVRMHSSGPNEIIKSRIILEAKRLLAHTELSVKEIGYKLGYTDPSYFIRLFTQQTKESPQTFRLAYRKQGEMI
ncbi:AraC-type DNA-binding protein [Pedobacter westerhofensis]|uniref:AraC-type DNA-binding protein n=1 Tax=Pedobacter westerhofensis TaxID=425512 RepID=A0A521AV08_9SPHI|nr:helix-turn-helix domain-containing protein [Pedobacter westerhofensis]SMO38635.1 AraC-type DNA-binding protein [Pedobacter westerhofensis]